MDYWNITAQRYGKIVTKIETSFLHITLGGLGTKDWTMCDYFGINLGTFDKEALLLQAVAPADLLRIWRVENITTLRTETRNVWNEIYFQQEGVPCKFICNVLLQIQERSSQFSGKYRLVHRGWQKEIVCGDCNQDINRGKTSGLETVSLDPRTGYFW